MLKPARTRACGPRLPPWLRKRSAGSLHSLKSQLRKLGLHTVCEEAKCPNIGECFARGTATFLLMGPVCTRRCAFCAVTSGETRPLDPQEPTNVARQVATLGLSHAVITSVTRDDLPDGGASHFVRTIEEIRRLCPHTTIEVLTPDFMGREEDIRSVCTARPQVFNHNVETVERLTPKVRDGANYLRSLEVLAMARRLLDPGLIKSGLMVGLGESRAEVEQTLGDLARAGCDVVTIGQYLQPGRDAMPVVQYVEPEQFDRLKEIGLKLHIKSVISGPFVRSSYYADQALKGGHEVETSLETRDTWRVG